MTDRPEVRIRATEPEDLDLLYRIENDTELWNIGSTNVPYSRYALHDYIATSSGDIYTDGQVRMIIETAGGRTVGVVDLVNFDAKNRRAEVGIIIERTMRRQGYAAAALQWLHGYACHTLHLHQLYVVVGVDNQPSVGLFRSMGYEEGGRLAQWLFDGKGYADAVIMQRML